MAGRKRPFLLVLAFLFVGQGLLSRAMFPSWKTNYSTGNVGAVAGLSPDQLLASLAGLRQMVAGILWVRSDEYFHSGQFDAILPLLRLVTWLNPRQTEVYATGAWHIGYNFTDEQNRSDRRYVPLGLRLLADGVAANPDTYLLYHEMGWMYYHKVEDDYDKAVAWFERAVEKPDVLKPLKSILATAYQRAGRLEDAVQWYWKLQKDADRQYASDQTTQSRILRDTHEKNLDNLLVRMASRGVFGRGDGVYEEWPYDTQNPVDLKFEVKVSVLEPKVLRVTGTWSIPTTGGRIRMVIRDADYNLVWEPAPSLDFDIDRDRTYMQDSLWTQNGQFDRKIDMSRNPTMYPFKSDKYYVEFYFNPRTAPPHIQDKIGWDGEGMTDKDYLDTEIRPGTRLLFARFEMTRDMMLRRGDHAYGAVVKSAEFQEIPTREESDVIIRGSLRDKG